MKNEDLWLAEEFTEHILQRQRHVYKTFMSFCLSAELKELKNAVEQNYSATMRKLRNVLIIVATMYHNGGCIFLVLDAFEAPDHHYLKTNVLIKNAYCKQIFRRRDLPSDSDR
uniref:Uncharacterized protein n=1 Tax=Glossina brevipalpis TaxID=37001 RepID=A0A1A9WV35_9MUSC